jgi:hypothetical protein
LPSPCLILSSWRLFSNCDADVISSSDTLSLDKSRCFLNASCLSNLDCLPVFVSLFRTVDFTIFTEWNMQAPAIYLILDDPAADDSLSFTLRHSSPCLSFTILFDRLIGSRVMVEKTENMRKHDRALFHVQLDALFLFVQGPIRACDLV